MRIAFFSDVHSNLPALEACFKSMAEKKPDAIYCLGDLVGYNVWPNEVINEIRTRGIPTIAGNYDQGIGLASDECGCAYKTGLEKENGQVSISYTNSVIGDDERAYLRNLPANIRIQYQLNGRRLDVLLVHGSPRRINEYLFEDRDEQSLLHIMEEADADIMCFGHTHKPYHRTLATQNENGTHTRHAINIGSVGKPKDNNPSGCYVIITINLHASPFNAESVNVEFVRFEYDIERAARAIEDSALPNVYADMLRTGR